MFASPKRSALLSWMLHGGAILLILAVTGVKPPLSPRLHDILFAPVDLTAYKPSLRPSGNGGGGGMHADRQASRGDLPRFAAEQFVKPGEVVNTAPILPMDMTLIGPPEIQLADYKVIGDPNGVLGKFSAGPGSHGGIGTGDNGGIGPGKGPGHGPGEDGGDSGVGYRGTGGGSVTAPRLVTKVDPEYSEEARKAKLQGTVLLRIEVNTQGKAQNFTIRQGLGLGLDEKAMDAVKKWKFLPGMVNGKPAVVVAFVEVNFRLL